MAEKKKYPERIYTVRKGDTPLEEVVGGRWGREQAYLTGVGEGLRMRSQDDPLEGFSNLTQAIQDGTKIDWEKIDELVAKCVHPEMGTLTRSFTRDSEYAEDTPNGWYPVDMTGSSGGWGQIFHLAWFGNKCWSLWVEGEIPVKPRTADEMKYGSIFKGKCPNGETQEFLVAYFADGGKCLIKSDIFKALSEYQPTQVEVVEVLSGGFIGTEEEA